LFAFFVTLLSIKMNKNGSMYKKHLILLILHLSLEIYLMPFLLVQHLPQDTEKQLKPRNVGNLSGALHQIMFVQST
jgi:hypothetical protein